MIVLVSLVDGRAADLPITSGGAVLTGGWDGEALVFVDGPGPEGGDGTGALRIRRVGLDGTELEAGWNRWMKLDGSRWLFTAVGAGRVAVATMSWARDPQVDQRIVELEVIETTTGVTTFEQQLTIDPIELPRIALGPDHLFVTIAPYSETVTQSCTTAIDLTSGTATELGLSGWVTSD